MGGPSGTTQTNAPPAWTTDYSKLGDGSGGPWQGYLSKVINQTNQSFNPYGGQRVADLTPEQRQAQAMTLNIAQNGSPDLNAARGQLMATSQGQYLSNPWTGADSTLGQTATGGALNSNPYLSNDYNDAVINQNAQNMTNAYRTGTAAQTDAQAALGGAFGGSAYQQMVQQNQMGLENAVGQMANTARLGQQGLQSQNYQQERGLQQNAALAGLGAYGQERANQMTAAGMAPGMAQTDYQAAAAIGGVGDQNRAYSQQLLDQGYNDYLAQQQYPYQAIDTLGNALTRSSGGIAGGSSAYATPASASPWANILGLGLLGAGAYGSYTGKP